MAPFCLSKAVAHLHRFSVRQSVFWATTRYTFRGWSQATLSYTQLLLISYRHIIDDGFAHVLEVISGREGGIRLLSSAATGEIRGCPVWTSFVTDQLTSESWIVRRGRHRILLGSLQQHIFCRKYRPERQKRKNGRFEVYFRTTSGL